MPSASASAASRGAPTASSVRRRADAVGARRALRLEGYEVDTVASGGEALQAVASTSPDALVLDLQLPDLDGLAVCRRIRESGDDIPILMLTARHGIDDRVQGLDAGADDYLVKPFALEELLARLRALLRRRFEGEGGSCDSVSSRLIWRPARPTVVPGPSL